MGVSLAWSLSADSLYEKLLARARIPCLNGLVPPASGSLSSGGMRGLTLDTGGGRCAGRRFEPCLSERVKSSLCLRR